MYFDINAHRDCFKTNKDEAYFWHGRTNDCGGQDIAMEIATENNGKTLERCMLDHHDKLESSGVEFLNRPDGSVEIFYGLNQEENRKFWDDCSKAFAEQSSGTVHVIEGSDPRPNGQLESEYPSTYNQIEHPALQENPNVNGISYIDPYTRQQTHTEKFSCAKTAGEPPRENLSNSTTKSDEISGSLPKKNAIQQNSETKIAGATPDKAQSLDFSNKGATDKIGEDLTEGINKKSGSLNSAAGIT